MTNKKTKRALLFALLAVALCVTMLMGTTFAWFTDSVSSVNNIIKSGNLDVELQYSTDGTTWADVDPATPVLPDALWEPGFTQVVYLRVKNAGTLALKYALNTLVIEETSGTNVYDEEFFLSDYLQYGVINENTITAFDKSDAGRKAARDAVANVADKISTISTRTGNLAPATSTEFALVIYMPEKVGNEANYKTGTEAPTITFGISLAATQYTYEADSFGIDYDADAPLPSLTNTVKVTNHAELQEALTTSSAGTTVVLEDGYTFGDIVIDYPVVEGITVVGNDDSSVMVKIKNGAELKDVTFSEFEVTYYVASGSYTDGGFIDIDGGAKVENLTLADSVINASGGRSCVIGISETSAIVTMDNCVVNGPKYVVYASAPIDAFTAVDCEIKNISSWAFMFNAGDAVGMNLTIDGCSFENCTGGIAKKLSGQHADATTVFTNNTLTGSVGHDGKDAEWFALNTAANTVSGNTLDGAAWTPGAAQGLGA